MGKLVQLQLSPEEARNDDAIRLRLREQFGLSDATQFVWRKRSIDARKKDIRINAKLELFEKGEEIPPIPTPNYHPNVQNAPEIVIIGAGPAGLFAALRALELGLKPFIYERGQDVRSRRRDLAKLNKESIVNPESNYCFGEGGAGTYSDGKLYTRSKKRGNVQHALETFVFFGADPDILVDAHPHIGTNKLPQVIVAMREQILKSGGEIHFEHKLTDLHVQDGKLYEIELNGKIRKETRALILATGHSARDIFYLLHEKGLRIQSKGFALGVRIEHRQELIDQIQYHGRVNDDFLPPASYSLATQVNERGVYSFCMCPGGIIAPCATEQNEVVTNGWSPSKRNNPYSNSGIVVSILPEDLGNPEDPFVCLNFQKEVEKACWKAAGSTQKVPAQRLIDFLNNVPSESIPRSSYQPGYECLNLNEILPPLIAQRLQKAFRQFGKSMPEFLTNDAVLHAPESRTSSPVQIPRDAESLSHPELPQLFPCGEGAGYAGGIISAAIDGMKCLDAAAHLLESTS
ncbi:MAG: FAD-binding protein [Bacteroidetes bacterium]|nr:MAG: FAD-binding protein [Bacteroidota bacterium]